MKLNYLISWYSNKLYILIMSNMTFNILWNIWGCVGTTMNFILYIGNNNSYSSLPTHCLGINGVYKKK